MTAGASTTRTTKSFGDSLWEPFLIVGETRASWLASKTANQDLKYAVKLPKTKDWSHDWLLNELAVDRWCWIRKNRHHIVGAVQQCDDHHVLRDIAAAVGYIEKP